MAPSVASSELSFTRSPVGVDEWIKASVLFVHFTIYVILCVDRFVDPREWIQHVCLPTRVFNLATRLAQWIVDLPPASEAFGRNSGWNVGAMWGLSRPNCSQPLDVCTVVCTKVRCFCMCTVV
ncbi:unnamed protein product, partial [Iphiclides podalirius]